MLITIEGFAGRLPKILDRYLGQNFATVASDLRLRRGDLEPFNVPLMVASVPDSSRTIYKHGDEWLSWDNAVDVELAAVADNRIYYTGDGKPKIRVGSNVHDLALPSPSTAPAVNPLSDDEQISINGVLFKPVGGATGTAGNVRYTVEMNARQATITLEPVAGSTITDVEMAEVINSIGYYNGSPNPTEGDRVFLITEIVDTGDDDDDNVYNTSAFAIRSVVSVNTDFDDYPAPEEDIDELDYQVDDEYVVIDGIEIKPVDGGAGYTNDHSLSYSVVGSNSYFTIKLSATNGLTNAQAEEIIESIGYVNKAPSDHMTEGTRMISLYSVKDNGKTEYNTGFTTLSASFYVNNDEALDNVIPAGEIDRSNLYDPADYDNRNDIPNNPPQAVADVKNTVYNESGVVAMAFSNATVDVIERNQLVTEIVIHVSNFQNRINDAAPLAVARGLNPNYEIGSGVVMVYDQAEVSVVDIGGQTIASLEFTVSNLVNGSASQDTGSTVFYLYTFVSLYDEESLPSPPSQSVFYDADMRVRLTDFESPPAGSRINRMRLYRSQTDAIGNTEFYFIDERNVSNGAWIDDQFDIVERLQSENYNSPPDDLAGITALPNGIMVGFSGKTICFSEPYIPHAWPQAYRYNIKDNPVAIGSFTSTAVIMTDGVPYMFTGVSPDSMSQEKSEQSYPCLSDKGAVDMGYTVVYPSTNGLVSCSNSGVGIVTKNLITPQQWAHMNPKSFVASEHEQRYFASYTDLDGKRGAFLLDMTGEQPFLINVSEVFDAAFHDLATDDLFIMRDGTVSRWDGGNGLMVGEWESKEFFLPSYATLGAMIVDSGYEASGSFSVQVIADGKMVAEVTAADRIVRLPAVMAKSWKFKYRGNYNIQRIRAASMTQELSQG